MQVKLCRLDAQHEPVVPSVAVHMPVEISLTQGKEIHREVADFLLPSHSFSALSWEGSLEVGAMSALLPIDWLGYGKQKRMHGICSVL